MSKAYEELEFIDDFMFCKVLSTNLELCRELLELILDIKISKVELAEAQKTIEMVPDAKGIRLDVYVDDTEGSVYDLEMQTSDLTSIPKRTRYYQGMIDLHLLERGATYKKLKKSFVIFLCTADPFKVGLPIYTFENMCIQKKDLKLKDEAYKIIVNPECNRIGLSQDLNSFLDLLQCKTELGGLAQDLQNAVKEARTHNKWRSEFMTLEMKLNEEREKGREEGHTLEILQMVSDGDISEERGAEKLGITVEELREKLVHRSANNYTK